jgi:hypothetical protein
MVSQQLLDYIRQQVQRGQTKEAIKQELLKVGWQVGDIEEALKAVDSTRLSGSYSSTSSSPAQGESLALSTLPGVGDLLKRAFSVYKTRLGTLVGIMAIPLIIGWVTSFLIQIAIPFIQLPSAGTSLLMFFLFFIILGLALALAIGLLSFWAQISLILAIKDREEKIGIIESFRRGWHKIISFFWVSFLVGFITWGGFMLFIIPGIIFSIWFGFSVYVLISEDLRGMNALFRSKQLVAGYWWKVLWRFFVFNCIIFLFYGFFIIAGLLAYFLAPSFIVFNEPAFNLISYLFTIFLTPFALVFGFLLYEDLKRQKTKTVFEPPKKGTKIKYILVGTIGFLLILAVLVLIVLSILSIWSLQKDKVREPAQEARIMANMIQLQATMELYAADNNYDYSGASCSLPEFTLVCSDIKENTGEMPTIESSADNYCFYVKLPSGQYACFASIFSSNYKTTIFPGGVGYCNGVTFNCP